VLKGPLTCGNAGRGPFRVPGGGIQMAVHESVITAFGRRPVTSANAEEDGRRRGPCGIREEVGSAPPCWCGPDPRAALPAGALTSATNDPRYVSAILDPRACGGWSYSVWVLCNACEGLWGCWS